MRLCRLWQSFTCLSTHCQSLLLKINFPSGPSRAKANKYKVIANSIQEELCEPQFQLHLQQDIWPLRSLADRTMTMAVSQSLVFLGGNLGTSEICHTEVPRWEWQSAISVEWKKPIKWVEARKEHYAYSKHKDLGKLKEGDSLTIKQRWKAVIQRHDEGRGRDGVSAGQWSQGGICSLDYNLRQKLHTRAHSGIINVSKTGKVNSPGS